MAARMKILVVDDDDSMRQAITRLLKAAGYENVTFPTAEACLASEATSTADCLISDLHLPAMSGLELLAELRRRKCGIPVILMTAFDEPGLHLHALERGAAAYLAKPFPGTALLKSIQELGGAGTGADETTS
jgi:FixJ family two-component response regulator